jgi:D-glycero-D-manno-heptose 1,7-bisphosphate phosphatase
MKLIVLDRDGVINHDSDRFIKTPEEWRAIAGSLEAIATLTQRGYRIAIATNQSGIGRGLLDIAAFNAINDKMTRQLSQVGGRIDAIFFCPHAADAHCECRKPKAGMLREIARRFSIDMKGVPVVGDSLRDLQAAQEVGAQPILVATGKGKITLKEGALPEGTEIYDDLAAYAEQLVGA